MDAEAAPEEGNQHNRAQWGGQLQFILTCVGYAVGLGNVWRFPYLAYRNGGGAFLLPYILMLATVGLPLFFMELAFGQFASLGPIAIWKINPLFKGLGYCSVWVSWLIGLYYNVIIAHVLFYLAASFTSELPWQHCNHAWNSPYCRVPDENYTIPANNTLIMPETCNASTYSGTCPVTITPTEDFYYNYVLEQSDNPSIMGGVSWKLALSLLVAWTIVCAVLIRGISSLGKIVYFTAIFPYVMLCILFIRGVTLPGPGPAKGILFYLTPRFEKLKEARVWSDAATQIFYSLSACSGGLIAMSSFNKFKNNCYRDSLIVALINCGTSVFAGMVIFSVLGFMAEEKGVSIDKVVAGGPGLAFIVYPEAISKMPVSPLWSVFFFIMMLTLGFGSQFSIVECVLSAFTDEFPTWLQPRRNNIIFRICACAVMFLLGLAMVSKGGIYLLNLVDYSVSGFPLLFVALLELIAINYIYGYDRFSVDIEMMLGSKPNIYWKICWLGVSPLVVSLVVITNCFLFENPEYTPGKDYPPSSISLGWCIALFPLLWIPGWFLYYYCKHGGYDILRINFMPLASWGPANTEHRDQVEQYTRVAGSDADSVQVQWNPGYTPGYIKSIASGLNQMGSKTTMSEGSATESQTNLSRVKGEIDP
ncbi:sodium- and chloride-dependent glycine transporter 2-like isoform X2 [Watersipora subatra]